MREQIEQLEERVERTVARLRAWADERENLRREVRELQETLARRDEQAHETTRARDDAALDRDAVLASLRRALSELRAE